MNSQKQQQQQRFPAPHSSLFPSLLSWNVLFTLVALALCCWASASDAYPAFYMQTIPRRTSQFHNHHQQQQQKQFHRSVPHKRAFDRLDVSPFDFDAMTKRFNDDELSALSYLDMYAVPSLDLRKRAFDRLEDSGFFGLQKRAFDRLDNSFMLIKRNSDGEEI